MDFAGYFGYSALVFKDGAHIHYCNDYELHHTGKPREELREFYLESLKNKLFTDDEFNVVLNYKDFQKKEYFLRNHYIQRIPYITAFTIIHNEKESREFDRKVKGMFYNPLSFCYVDRKYISFCQRQAKLLAALCRAKENASKDNFGYWKSAFLYEMWNHEYGINWDGDYEVLNCFGNLEYKQYASIGYYFNQLNFTDTQKKAYEAARREYYAESNRKDEGSED